MIGAALPTDPRRARDAWFPWRDTMTVPPVRALGLSLALFAGALLWSYWTTLAEVLWRWTNDPQYSHGYLVPGFACYLLWQRRALLEPQLLRPSAWGLPV